MTMSLPLSRWPAVCPHLSPAPTYEENQLDGDQPDESQPAGSDSDLELPDLEFDF